MLLNENRENYTNLKKCICRILTINGKYRIIHEPLPSLKEIQNWILKYILTPIANTFVSPVAKAYMPKTSVRDNARSYDWPVIIRAVNTVDAMTATIEEIEWPVLHKITNRILAEVPNVNRVCYDLSPKPNATIEWE